MPKNGELIKQTEKKGSDNTVVKIFQADFIFLSHSLFSLKGDILS